MGRGLVVGDGERGQGGVVFLRGLLRVGFYVTHKQVIIINISMWLFLPRGISSPDYLSSSTPQFNLVCLLEIRLASRGESRIFSCPRRCSIRYTGLR